MDSADKIEFDQSPTQESQQEKTFAERFEIIEELGHGGMSIVYRAREILLDRQVAIKVLNQSFTRDAGSLQRFRNEARACSALHHPNIVRILSYGITKEEQPFIIMELLEGKSLEQELKEKGAFEIQKFEEIFLPVMDALVYAHASNTVHRDLKPGNLMVLADQGGSRQVKVKIVDFGIAKVLEGENIQDTQATVGLLGSPLYMSPEQCAGGKVDQRSDIYSLACVMYESIVGKPPFSGDTPLETMYEHLKSSVPRLVEVSGSLQIPKALFDVIVEALAKDPAERPQSMQVFRDRVLAALTRTDTMKRKGASGFTTAWPAALYLFLTCMLVLVLVQLALMTQSPQKSAVWSPAKKDAGVAHVSDMTYLKQSKNLQEQGHKEAALQKGLEALRVASRLKLEHPVWLCAAHLQLASVYDDLNDSAKVRQEYKAAIDVFPAPSALDRQNAVNLYCCWLANKGNLEEALSYFRDHLRACERYLAGDPDRDVATGHLMFAKLLFGAGRYKESASEARQSLGHYDRLTSRRNVTGAVEATFVLYDCCLKLGKAQEGLLEVKKTGIELQQEEFFPDINCFYTFAQDAAIDGLDDEALPLYKLCIKYAHTYPNRAKGLLPLVEKEVARLEKKN